MASNFMISILLPWFKQRDEDVGLNKHEVKHSKEQDQTVEELCYQILMKNKEIESPKYYK